MSLLDATIVTGDIWSKGAFSFDSPLKDLLDSGEYTLEQLLAEDELLQELRGVHPQLIEFFTNDEVVADLVHYIVDDEPRSVAAARRRQQQQIKDTDTVRFPYMACEVICCEIAGVIDSLVDGRVVERDRRPPEETNGPNGDENNNKINDEEAQASSPRQPPRRNLDVLFALLYSEQPVDDYRAGYFDKVLSVLFRKRPQAMTEYINSGGERGKDSLMKAFFSHLYSHSIMQIVQRLLMPRPQTEEEPPEQQQNENALGEDIFHDPLDAVVEESSQCFYCDWGESRQALDLLMRSLVDGGKDEDEGRKQDDETKLNVCRNASEVIITIIQNSPLTSPTLFTLTTDPVLKQLVDASCILQGTFLPHDSKLTCAINVLESLILQLGGYGSVGTVLPENNEEEEEEEIAQTQDMHRRHSRSDLANPLTLVNHLPHLLLNLSELLMHPDAESWTSAMQFAKSEPQKILGTSRLRIVRLLESLVLLGDPDVDILLCESSCLEICLDLFWKFRWCSMLHQSVANLLVHVFEGGNDRMELQTYFINKCGLLGRLMDSFSWDFQNGADGEVTKSDVRLSEVVIAMKGIEAPTAACASERGSSASTDSPGAGNVDKDDLIPVSDDDVEAALEAAVMEKKAEPNTSEVEQVSTEAVHADSQEASTEGILFDPGAPAQAFRLGYMGHVIIICQALVHACSGKGGETPSVVTNESQKDNNGNADAIIEQLEKGESLSTQCPLVLVELVNAHALRSRWEEFVTTTLASETTVQSTPLGGYNASAGISDPLQSHRPGLDEPLDDDGVSALQQRGLLVGGEVLDMDDNDLEIAASMMAGLSLARAAGTDSSGRLGSDAERLDLSRGLRMLQSGVASAGNYVFDDPLGDSRFDQFADDDDSSSEEDSVDTGGAIQEGQTPHKGHNRSSGDGEVPVIDLFAGNFTFRNEDGEGSPNPADQDLWSNFANFDDAFATSSVAESSVTMSTTSTTSYQDLEKADGGDSEEPDDAKAFVNGEVEDLFVAKVDPALLLDEGKNGEKLAAGKGDGEKDEDKDTNTEQRGQTAAESTAVEPEECETSLPEPEPEAEPAPEQEPDSEPVPADSTEKATDDTGAVDSLDGPVNSLEAPGEGD